MKQIQLVLIGNAHLEMENFLCTVLQTHFITEGVSFNKLEFGDTIINLWHVSQEFEDINTIKQLLQQMNIIIYCIDILNATKVVSEIQQLADKVKAVQLYLEISVDDERSLGEFAQKFQMGIVHYDMGSLDSAKLVLTKALQIYDKQVSETIQQFKQKLFK